MIASLSIAQRRNGLAFALCLALLGLLMAAAAQHGPMVVHGAMALVLGIALTGALARAVYDPPPEAARASKFYYDDPTRFGVPMTLIWAVVAMGVGVWVAALLSRPEATPAVPWTSLTAAPGAYDGVIFGFRGDASDRDVFLRAAADLAREKLADELSPWIVLLGFNLFCLWAVTGYLMGITQ